jgi:shikimate dehydrogenase
MTRKAGIVGWPVTHSLSPVLHGYWLKEYGIDGEMLRVPARPEEFANVIARLRNEGFRGVNVTVPHKEAALAIADRADDAARLAGAANLLIFRENGTIDAKNTDTHGLAESVGEALGKSHLLGKKVIILGAGGASRGVVAAMKSPLGASLIHILNRDVERAHNLAKHLSEPGSKTKLIPGSLNDWGSVANDVSLVVNSTSAGMSGNPPLDLDLSVLPESAAVCDIVYNPLETQLLKEAKALGHKTIDGLGMLMHQAVPSFEAFFGKWPEVTPGLRAELERVLRERQ